MNIDTAPLSFGDVGPEQGQIFRNSIITIPDINCNLVSGLKSAYLDGPVVRLQGDSPLLALWIEGARVEPALQGG